MFDRMQIILTWENCEKYGYARRAYAERAMRAEKGTIFAPECASVVEREGRFFIKSFHRRSYIGDVYRGRGGVQFIGIK